MLALAFFKWWYGPGWLKLVHHMISTITRIARTFSVPQLIMTLFSPWRRIITYGNRNVREQMRALLDNFISRCVGAGVRIIVILAASLSMALTGIGGVLIAIAWPLMPAAAVWLLVRGIV